MSILRRVIRKLRKPPEIQGPVKIIVNGQEHLTVTGQTVLRALKTEDIDISHYCGGVCTCGTCDITVLSGSEWLTPVQPREELVLGVSKLNRNGRLACQARLKPIGEGTTINVIELKVPKP